MKAERKIVSEQWAILTEVNRARRQVSARPFASIVEARDELTRLQRENPENRYFLSRAGEERGIQ